MRKMPAEKIPSVIAGIGIDIANVARIRAVMRKPGDRFVKKILTPEEIRQLKGRTNKVQFIASRFAAKEAFYKAVSSVAKPAWHDVSIVNDREGRPKILFENARLGRLLRRYTLHISISHDNQNIVVVCILELKYK